MNDNALDPLLEKLQAKPLPDAPKNLESRVLREIRLSTSVEDSEDGALLPSLWSAPARFAAIMGVLAMGAGLMVGSAFARSAEVSPAHSARLALSLDVFDVETVTLSRKPRQK